MISRYLILILILIIFLISSILIDRTSNPQALANSPSFVRQEIIDDTLNDWLLWKGPPSSSPLSTIRTHDGVKIALNTTQDISECRAFKGSSPDIESVSYISDGNKLNATIWLTGPFRELPQFDNLDTFQENLKLSIKKTDLDLENYTILNKGLITNPALILEENSSFLSGYPAHEVVQSNRNGSANDPKVMQVWAVDDKGNAFNFTYSALGMEKYSKFLPEIRQMLDSFTIENNTTTIKNKGSNISSLVSNQPKGYSEGFVVYNGNGFIINYPRDWVVEAGNSSQEETTLTFISPFEGEVLNEPSWREMTYTMAVDVDSVHDAGTDYRIKMLRTSNDSNNGKTGKENLSWNWTKQIQEVSAYDKVRILNQTGNYSSFYKSGDPYILFSFDLGSVNAPQQYKAVFYITDYYVINHRLCRLIDMTNWVIIPPPDFDISIKPDSSIELRPNDQKAVQLQIKGNSDLQSQAFLTTDATHSNSTNNTACYNSINPARDKILYGNNDVCLQFDPDIITVPPSGVGTSTVYIKALQYADDKLYTFPIISNISFPTSISNRGGEIFNNSRSVNIMESANLTLNVLRPYSPDEQMNNFVSAWITPISGVWSFIAGVGAVIAPLILYIYRRKQKDKEMIQ